LHVVDPFAAFTIEPGPQTEQAVWLVSYCPAPHCLHIVEPDSLLTIEPPPQAEHASMVPPASAEYVPAPHGLFVVPPRGPAGHSYPFGHGLHSLVAATPATS
jgi:hypothetical protein